MPLTQTERESLAVRARERACELSTRRLVLYAGANLPSAAAQKAYAAGLSAYPAMGPSFDKEQPETDIVSRFEVEVSAEICGLFGAAWAEPRLPSCTLANLAVFHAFSKPGDLLLAPAGAHGGHLSQRKGGTPELAGLVIEDLPFDSRTCRLDAPAAAEMTERLRPRLIMLGRSVIITPDDIGPVVESARRVGATTIFDASHVSGLIAGGVFPNPLAAGVDIVTTSTYKTLPGRPQGIVMGRDAAQGALLSRFADRFMLANYDAGKLPSLLMTLKSVAQNGGDYARRVLGNTQALAAALQAHGLPVIAPAHGLIFTHQILVPLSPDAPPQMAIAHLERHGVLAGTCADPTRPGGHALRIGTQFLTREGVTDRDMEKVASILSQLLAPGTDGQATLIMPGDSKEKVANTITAILAGNQRGNVFETGGV